MEHIEIFNNKYHLQGISSDGEYMYWSNTDTIVKSTIGGSPRAQVEIFGGHLGDCDVYDGRLYVTYLGDALPGHRWGDWTAFYVYVFDTTDLSLVKKIRLDECYKFWDEKNNSPSDTRGFNGVDGTCIAPDPDGGEMRLFLACGIVPDPKYTSNVILKYSLEGEFLGEYRLPCGNTDLGIQNLDYDADAGEFWFTTYGRRLDFQESDTLWCVSGDLTQIKRRYRFPTAVGFHCLGDGEFWATAQWGAKWKKCAVAYKCEESFFENEIEEIDAIKLVLGEDFRYNIQ